MSEISFHDLGIRGIQPVLRDISAACHDLGIEFFIVGSIARNRWLVSNNENPRGTKDVDFAVYVKDQNEYSQLKNLLIDSQNYSKTNDNPLAIVSESGIQVDLLPFGEIEEDGQVLIRGRVVHQFNLAGFQETFRSGIENVSIGEIECKSCTIPALVLLKFIAYDDRPEMRVKDLRDINLICRFYSLIESDFVFDHYLELINGDRDFDETSWVVLGCEMAKIVLENPQLYRRVIRILVKAINSDSRIPQLMIENPMRETIEDKVRILTFLLEGFQLQPPK